MYCSECGEGLVGDAPKFCGKCGQQVAQAEEPNRLYAAERDQQEVTGVDPLPFGGVELGGDGWPANNSDWTSMDLDLYRDLRFRSAPLSEKYGDVERRWIVAHDELPVAFPDLPDIGYCEMEGDGFAIPPVRDWPKKYLKKGFPITELLGKERRCTRRAVTRWCHVMVTFDPSLGRRVPTAILKYVDTCPGHEAVFRIPNPPSLGRGPTQKVGYWRPVNFSSY